MQVDNSIKQGCNASLQGRFEIKQRDQKPLQGGFAPKQRWLCFIAEAFSGKTGGIKLLSGWIFSKTRGTLLYCRGVLLPLQGGFASLQGCKAFLQGSNLTLKPLKKKDDYFQKLTS
jgi:hypothetical protein